MISTSTRIGALARGLRFALRLLAATLGLVTAASAVSVTYEYDQLGRLRKAIYEDGTVIVYTLDPAGNRTSVATGIDNTAPSVPTGLTGTATNAPAVNLSWTASTDTGVGIGGYRIFRNGTQVGQTTGTGTTFSDTNANGVIGSTAYAYRVAAYDLAGNVSGQSNVFNVTTPAVSESIPPSVPSGLAVAPTSQTTTTLTWNASTDTGGSGLAGYKIYRGGTQIGTSATTSYNDSGLSSGAYYEYRVAAYDNGGNTSTPSSIVSITMPTIPPGTVGISAVNGAVQVLENAGVATVTVVRNGGTYTAASVTCGSFYDVNTHTALPNVDFTPASTVLSWGPNQSQPKTCSVPIIDDNIQEVTWTPTPAGTVPSYIESFAIVLSNPVGATIGTSSALAEIDDDDTVRPDTTPPNQVTGVQVTGTTPTSITLGWTPTTDTNGKIVAQYVVVRCQGSSCNPTTQTQGFGTFTNSITDTSVGAQQTWRYAVRAVDGAGNASASYSSVVTATTPAAPDTTRPSNVSGFAAAPLSSTSIRLTWSAATDNVAVTNYVIERCTGASCSNYAPLTTVGPVTLFDDTGLSASTTYGYRIVARDAALNTSLTPTTTSGTTQAPPDTSKPTQPGGFAASSQNATTIRLTWNASTDNVGVIGYMLERCTGAGCINFAAVNTIPINALTYDDGSAAGATTYVYRVMARDAAGNNSDPSSTASATTYAPVPLTVGGPGGTVTIANYTVSWTVSGGTGVTYELQESKNDATFGSPTTYPSQSGTSQSITGKNDGDYWYRVRACNVMGCSAYRTATSAVIVRIPDTTNPTTPTGFNVVPLGSSSNRLTWQASTDDRGVTSYRIERCAGLGCTTFAEVGSTTTALTFDDTGLASNSMYRYQVKARDAAGNNSDPTSIIAGVTFPDVPASVTMPGSPNTNGSYTVSWAGVSGASAVTYELQESFNDSGFGSPSSFTGLTGVSQFFSGKANGTYYYRVRACNITACSGYRTAATSVTVAIPDTTRPDVVPNVAAIGISSSVVRITWTAASDNVGVTGYIVNRCTTSTCSAASTDVGTTANNVFTFDDSILAGITQWYRVYARDAAGNVSATATIVAGTTYPPVPLSLSVPTGTSTTGAYDLSWTIASGSNITYEIQEAKNDPGFGSGITNYTSNGTAYNVTGRTDGTYYYRIRACNVMGCSGYQNGSNSITVAIPAGTQIFIDDVSIFGQQEVVGLGFDYSLAASGQVLISGTGALSVTGPAHTFWLSPVSGMNQFQVNATTTCGNVSGIAKRGNFDASTWQSLGASNISWGMTINALNRFAQCSITIRVRAAANPGVILDTGVINIDLSTAP